MSSYRGLINEGSTCYLNSLLQTLFMTPQFRQNVFNYVHDERKISAADSIPYQLQKLFVLLQLNQSSVYTKGLLKSFQWNQIDSFQQHDVQEFCRVLFEALEKASKGANWIQKLYSGVMESYITCGKHPRANQQIFMDISLAIKNQYTSTLYNSIEECLKQYLRPENIDDKIDCEGCGQKVKVEKGMRILNLPPILTLQVNRFQLNYTNMQREKINSFLYFAEILDLWRFTVPFQQIQIKGIPKDLFDKVKLIQKQKSARQIDWGIGGGLSITGRKIERKKSFEIEAQKKQTKFYDEQNRDKRQDQVKKLTPQQEKIKNLQILTDLKADSLKFNKKDKKVSQQSKQNNKQQVQVNQSLQQNQKQQKSNSLDDDMLFGSFMDGFDRNGQSNINKYEDISIANQTSKGSSHPKFQKTQTVFEHIQQSFDPNKQYPKNTYILFSILVHSGGAYGGHYYAYIFDGIDWFCFNDNNVRKVTKEEIRKYGHPSQQSSYGANAYLLFYRQASSFKNVTLQNVKIPQQLLEKVRNDKVILNQPTKQEKLHHQIKSRYQQIQNSLILKIKYKNDLQTIMIPDRYSESVQTVKHLIKATIDIKEDDKNWRLRRYNKSQDSMHQIYDIKQNLSKTLDQVGLKQTCYMVIEVKLDDEQFPQYDPKNITIKLNVWREGLTLLTETYLKPIKIGIRQQKTFDQFYKKVQNLLKIKNPLIIKRNFSVGNPLQIFSNEVNSDKTLLSLRFFNGINLYVEQTTDNKSKWQKQFQDEKYKCQIKFNNPKEGIQKNYQVFLDTRKTLGDLKLKICQIIGIDMQQFRIKKSQQAVSQMTSFKKRLTDLKFVNVEYLHIQEGKSSKGTLLIRKSLINILDDQIQVELGQQFQLQIQGNVATVADLKKKLSQKYGLSEFNIRVRQLKAHQFAQIFRDSQSLLKIRQKSLIWQQLQIEDPKGLQIYFRVFDVMTLQLGHLQTIFAQRNGNCQELALILQEQTGIKNDKILIHKPMSSFVDKSLLFQCQWIQVRFLGRQIRDEPLYLNCDGDFLIIKQAQVAYDQKPNQRYTSTQNDQIVNGNNGKSNKKEAALKITVVQEKQQQFTQIISQPIEKQTQKQGQTNIQNEKPQQLKDQ